MNRKQLKLCMIVICLASMLLACSTTGASEPTQTLSWEERMAAQKRAVMANEALAQYFYANGFVVGYPEYINGCYIEGNVLHIRLVLPTEQEMAALNDVLSNYKDVIIYEYSQYSHAELIEYAGRVAAELEKQGCEVTQYCVDSITGNIVIGVLPEHVQTAKALVEKQQICAMENTFPKIVIEEAGYIVLD